MTVIPFSRVVDGDRRREPHGSIAILILQTGGGRNHPQENTKPPRTTADREQAQKQKKIKDCSSRFVGDRVGRESGVGDGLQCGRGINGYNLFLGGKRRLLVIGGT